MVLSLVGFHGGAKACELAEDQLAVVDKVVVSEVVEAQLESYGAKGVYTLLEVPSAEVDLWEEAVFIV